jgi:NAD(P)H-flavin reductase
MAAPRKAEAVVSSIRQFKGNITLYTLTTEIVCRFKPGQFLHLAIDPYDPSFNWPESRVFSIVNAPVGGNEIEILISPKGAFTQRMIREIAIGTKVWIKLPFGIFNFDAAANKNVVLIAGGTGISPFLSFLRSQLTNPVSYKSLTLFYGVRIPSLVIFDEMLEECAGKINGFHYRVYCEHGVPAGSPVLSPGLLPVGEIVKNTSRLTDLVYYLSGPAAMIGAFENELHRYHIPDEQILYDRWE